LLALLVLSIAISPIFVLFLGVYLSSICIDSIFKNKSLSIGLLSVVTSLIQLIGYGSGFLLACWQRLALGKGEFAAYEKNFYK